jgi:alpha-ketoglutarate-dependent taurine dioxygenase
MTITVCPVTPSFAAEIGDVDLSASLAPSDVQAIKDAFAKYAVLIFPDQNLSQDQHLDFARYFGPLETTIALHRKDAKLRVRKEFADVSNLDPENQVWGKDSRQRMFQLGNRLWHTDSSFKRLPALASLLYARTIPTVGGHTELPMTRCPNRRSAASTISSPSIRSSTRARGSASPISATRNGRACHRCRKCWCARCLNPAASRFIWRRTPGGYSACPKPTAAR